jgi:hypothetical protein
MSEPRIEAGCLVERTAVEEHDNPYLVGDWDIVRVTSEDDDWTGIDPEDSEGTPIPPEQYRVLLPPCATLSEGEVLAEWDAHCEGEAHSGPGRIWKLEDGYMALHRKDDGPWYPVYWLWNDWEYGCGYVTPKNREAHERDMQRYGAAVQWWLNSAHGEGVQ